MREDDGTELFPGFEPRWIGTPSGRWFARAGGPEDGPPLLLLHGFPQTHAMWHRLAPALARDHRVICLDLRGYGWTDAPEGTPDRAAYAKRTPVVRRLASLLVPAALLAAAPARADVYPFEGAWQQNGNGCDQADTFGSRQFTTYAAAGSAR